MVKHKERILFLILLFMPIFVSLAYTLIAGDNNSRIRSFVGKLTLEELIGQTLMIGYYAGGPTESVNGLTDIIARYKVGSIIINKSNINVTQVDEDGARAHISRITDTLQDTAFNSQPEDKKIPLIIAADQEGGARFIVRKGITRIPDAIFIGGTRSEELALKAGSAIGSGMKMLGLNMILAPVVDIYNNDEFDVIGKRAFGRHKAIVSQNIMESEQKKLFFFQPEELLLFLEEEAVAESTKEERAKGYKVKILYQAASDEEKKVKRDAVAQVIIQALKRMREKK